MTAPELKPCPFCGRAMEITDDLRHYNHPVSACFGRHISIAASDIDRIEMWNRRADLAAVQPMQVHPDPRDDVIAVKVKPLVWGDYPNRAFASPYVAVAEAPFSHRYQVQRDPWANSFMAYLHPTAPIACSTLWWESKGHATIEDAKTAAQDDYEARIMSAVDVQPDPRDEVIARLVEALERIGGVRGPYSFPFPEADLDYGSFAVVEARVALAAAKAVMK